MKTYQGAAAWRSGRIVVLVLLLIATLVAPASAKSEVPFKGSFAGHAVVVDQRCGPDVTLAFLGTGTATQLGRWTGEASNCTEWAFPVASVEVWDGIVTFVAADGSTIVAAYEGLQEAPVDGVAAFLFTQTLVSGSGRFANATGSWIVSGSVDFTTLAIHGTIDGWISR